MAGISIEFDRPPVREAVIGIEFNPLPLGIVHLAALYERWKAAFPIVQEQPALDPSVAAGLSVGSPMIQFGSGVPPTRLWLIEPSGNFLVQLQRDRLTLNWRKLQDEATYPRYVVLREKFDRLMRDFRLFLHDVSPGAELGITVAEFTYINGIAASDRAESMYSVIHAPSTPLPGTPLMFQYQEIRNVENQAPHAPGQVSIVSQPVFDGVATEVQLTVTTKFFPTDVTSDEDVLAVLDAARNISRETFVAFTSDEMHTEWGATHE